MKNAPPSPPTPAEVAEARTWFDADPTRINALAVHGTKDARYAAVLVRATLAAPAEQPREDDERQFTARRANGACLICGGSFAEHARRDFACPPGEPAVSAGGAGRDLTAQDVEYGLRDWRTGRWTLENVADFLNAIARPADTATQATEQTTLFRLVDEDGDTVSNLSAIRDTDWYGSYDDAERAARIGLERDYGPLRVESATARVVSPWSPVAVHDENGAQA